MDPSPTRRNSAVSKQANQTRSVNEYNSNSRSLSSVTMHSVLPVYTTMQPWAVSCPVEWLLCHRKQLLIRGWPTTIVQADRLTCLPVPALIPSPRLSSLVAVVVVVGHNYSGLVYFSERARTDINARLPFTATAD